MLFGLIVQASRIPKNMERLNLASEQGRLLNGLDRRFVGKGWHLVNFQVERELQKPLGGMTVA